jgi:prepilin peptidase CpaA
VEDSVRTTDLVLWFIAIVALVVASVHDVRDRLIPNTLVLIVLGVAIGTRIGGGVAAAGLSLLATAIVAALAYFLADRDYIGWGDAKMIAATSLLVPPPIVVPLIFDIVIAGGALGCLYVLARICLRQDSGVGRAAEESRPSDSKFGGFVRTEMARIVAHEPMPYGVAILGGVSYCILSVVRTR